MVGFILFFQLIFPFVGIFGNVMEDSDAADVVVKLIVDKLIMQFAVIPIVVACAILTDDGVSVIARMMAGFLVLVWFRVLNTFRAV